MVMQWIGRKWAWAGLLLGAGLSTGCREAEAGRASEAPVEEAAPQGMGKGPGLPSVPSEPPARDARRPWLRASFYAGVAPGGLAVGDLNGDGAPDVAVNTLGRNYSSQYVTSKGRLLVLLNDGHGGLGRVLDEHPPRSSAGSVVMGDVNGDGRQDVLAGTLFGARVMLGRGDGTLQDMVATQYFCELASYDMGLWKSPTGMTLLWSLGVEHDWLWSSMPRICEARFTSSERFTQWDPSPGNILEDNLSSGSRAAVADFNEDGFPDFVFNRQHEAPGGRAQIFLGNAAGLLSPSGSLSLVRPWTRVVTADFDRDGHADLLGLAGDTLWVFLGTGQGGFSQAFELRLDAEASEIAVGNLDTDGLPDVVAVHDAGEVSLIRGQGRGGLVSLGRMAVGRRPSAAATADLDGDGLPELLVAEEYDNTVSVYAIPDAPITSRPLPITCPLEAALEGPAPLPAVSPLLTLQTEGASKGVVGDFDADGKKDLALALVRGGVRLVFHAQRGLPRTRALDIVSGRVAASLAAGDLDGDGRDDLVGDFRRLDRPINDPLFDMLILWNEADAPFAHSQDRGYWWWANDVITGDFNGDGRVDMATSNLGHRTSSGARLINLGNREFRAYSLMDYNPTWDDDGGGADSGRPLAADFNGDGTLDLVHLTEGLNINPTAADGSSLPGEGFSFSATDGYFHGATDADGDGRVDVLTQWDKGRVMWLRGDGHGTVQTYMECALPRGEQILAWEDLNADGSSDLVSVEGDGTRMWVVPRTPGQWGAPRLYPMGAPITWVRSVDLVGDERPELVVMLRTGQLHVFPTPGP